MNIAIVGIGYVGLVTGTCFADIGANVFCVDTDKAKIAGLQKGIMPIFEPGLEALVEKNAKAGRLHFTTDLASCISDVEIIFSAVGTPSDKDGSADLKYVLSVAKSIGQLMQKHLVIVTKSTVPVGTSLKIRATIQAELDKRGSDLTFDVASNPEFLKEGAAIKDFMSPDRVVVGVDTEYARALMEKLYKPFLLNNFRVLFMDIPSAEMTKYAANAMLATRISFMNDMANLCDLVGADINSVRKGIGSDTRIGNKFLYSGCGYGGSCFPKDVKAIIKTAKETGYQMGVLEAVEAVNDRQKEILFSKLCTHFAKDGMQGKTVAVFGLSFKPNTDDMREATSLVFIKQLLATGAKVRVYDPIVKTLTIESDAIYYAQDIYDAAQGADAIVLVTEWQEFRLPDWNKLAALVNNKLIIDGRNIYDKAEVKSLGFTYEGIGTR